MKVLAVDAGNSRIKWGLHTGADWREQSWTDTARPELAAQWAGLPTPESIIVSNVAGSAAARYIEAACQPWHTKPCFIRAEAAQCGVRNGYAIPHQLGSDRWAALIAAHHLYPGHDVLVVQSGTAVTIDNLAADGLFRGGLILPGFRLMLDALARNTASLPAQHGKFAVLPDNTADAMFSGTAHAIAGAIERSYRALATRPLCLLSGGDMDILLPVLGIPATTASNLVLEGLLRIAQKL